MANTEQVALLKRSVHEWNEWRAALLAGKAASIDASLRSADFRELDYTEADIIDLHRDKPDLSRADLSKVDLRCANLCLANLSLSILNEADLSSVDLRNANLAGAVLRKANLRGANLHEAILREGDLSWAIFCGACLRDADLSGGMLARADFEDADLRGADLSWTNLSGANLVKADLSRANLRWTNLLSAKLNRTNFTEAAFGWAAIGGVDFRGSKGVERIVHHGPTSIGIDAVYASGGEIPEAFMRGAGIPDNFIAYMSSLVGKPIQLYSCFISYSTHDQVFADRLWADLQAAGVRCWYAGHDMAGGKKVHEQIDEAIRLHERLLLILSPASMQSEWVKTEIAKARRRELKEKRRVLFPIRLVDFETIRDWECFDADTGKDSAREIREYFIPDFSQWKDHDCYKKAFDRLLRNLKAEAGKAAGK